MAPERKVRKKVAAPKPESAPEKVGTITVPFLPNLTFDQQKKLQAVLDQKQHLEYLCFMMLDNLNRRLLRPMRSVIEAQVRLDRFDSGVIDDFFGDKKASPDNAGLCEAGGHTVDSLLDEWQKVTHEMMDLMAGRA